MSYHLIQPVGMLTVVFAMTEQRRGDSGFVANGTDLKMRKGIGRLRIVVGIHHVQAMRSKQCWKRGERDA